jgi:hypothetical protein
MNPHGERASQCADWFETNETKIICAFAAALLLLNLATSLLYPTSWMDECMFSDPAIHYVQGQGFTSTAWWQNRDLTWSGNVPLYTLALIPWFKLIGFGLVKARAFNYTIISLTLLIFWLGIKRLKLIRSASARVGLIVTAFLSYAFCFPYRSARPDCLGMLICAVALLAWSSPNRRLRNVILFIAGFLAPFSGLQLAAYFGFLCVLIFILERTEAIPKLAFIIAGVGIGAISLFSYYHFNHLTGIQETIAQTRQFHEYAETAGHTGPTTATERFVIKLHRIAADEYSDFAIAPTLLALVCLAFDRKVWSVPANRLFIFTGIISSFALTAALEFFLHYLAYYHWMNYIIVVTALFALISRVWIGLSGCKKIAFSCLVILSIAGGLPLRLGLELALNQQGQYFQIIKLSDEQLKTSDVVFADYMAYFPAKARARDVMVPTYLSAMTELERQSINVIMVPPESLKYYLSELKEDAQQWEKAGEYDYQPGMLGRCVMRFWPHYATQPTSCGYAIVIVRKK